MLYLYNTQQKKNNQQQSLYSPRTKLRNYSVWQMNLASFFDRFMVRYTLMHKVKHSYHRNFNLVLRHPHPHSPTPHHPPPRLRAYYSAAYYRRSRPTVSATNVLQGSDRPIASKASVL